MDNKIAIVLGLVLILGVSIIWWLSSSKECSGCGYMASEMDFWRVRPPATYHLLKNGTLIIDFVNAFDAEEITIEDIEIIYEGECYNEEKRGVQCNIEEPMVGSKFPKGTMFRVIAHCSYIKKDAELAFLYVTLTYKTIKDGDEVSRTSEGGICIGNDGDMFSKYAFVR